MARKKDAQNSNEVIIQASNYKDGILTRICPKCGRELPFSEFGLRAMKPHGQVLNQSWCKECRLLRPAPQKLSSALMTVPVM